MAAVLNPQRIDQQVVWRHRKLLYSVPHGDAGGLVDVDPVDRRGVDLGDRDRQSDATDAAVQPFALPARELLVSGPASPGQCRSARGEEHGRRDDGAEQSAAPYLVHAGDRLVATVAQRLLRSVRADQLLQQSLLGSRRLQRPGGDGADGGHADNGDGTHVRTSLYVTSKEN